MTNNVKLAVALVLIGVASLSLRAAETPSDEEISAWESALSSGEAANLEQFLVLYPDSLFSSEAQALLVSIEAVASDPAVSRGVGVTALSPYEQPLTDDLFADEPRSIRQLAEGTPLFAPVEGLPVEYWQEEVCSNCHNWEKANLCVQGEYFAQRDQAAIDRIEHPYGGFFKSALKRWAANGCE